MESYSLFQLNEYVKRIMALNFPEPIWIKAEIAQIKESRGNYYLDLIEKDDQTDQVIAQASAVIWFKSYLFINKKLGQLSASILSDGTEVNVKVKVEFSERYGHKLVIVDIDASYTIGQLEIQRQVNLERLKKEGLLDINKNVPLPSVIKNIAVISSETAAGYGDFINQLNSNTYGYQFNTTLFQSAMQGRATSREVAGALLEIQEKADRFDCIVIIRGGGSKLDLSGFDDYNIGFQIAKCTLPVLTGIGHQIDLSVADVVAHLHLKTPTAVANYLIDRNLHFESDLLNISQSIQYAVKSRIQHETQALQQDALLLASLPAHVLSSKHEAIKNFKLDLKLACQYQLKTMQQYLTQSKNFVLSVDPKRVLNRGFVIIEKDGKIQESSKQIKKGDVIDLVFKDGKRNAKIQ